jgi:glycosyltransferase involved in cell wall biosynthesis
MRILQVISTFYPALAFGGPVKVAYDICTELAKRGHEVEVFTTNAYDQTYNFKPKFREQIMNGFKVTYFKNILRYSNLFISPEMIVELRKKLKEFDVVHTHFGRQAYDVVVGLFASRYGVPYVLQAHGSIPRIEKRFRQCLYDAVFGYRILKNASKVIALSRVEAEQYMAMGVPDEKIAIIPNGIDLSEYAVLPSKGVFRKKFGIDDEKIVLYLGRIHRIKGVDVLVRAFANIVEKLDDAKLVVAGPDDGYLGELESLIKALKIEDKVLISGPLYGRDKLEAYVDADVYVLPSRYEIFGMTVLESVACGTPVILTEDCGIAEYFRDKTGLVVKTDSPSNLQEALLEMLMNREKQKVFRENCKTVMQKFNISETVSKLEKVYEEIV